MDISIVEIHPASKAKELNTEWFVLENTSDKPFSTRNCTIAVSKQGSKKRRSLGTIDPGFTVAPGGRVRVITGNPGKKSQGKQPSDEIENYSLFLGGAVLQGPGTQIVLTLRSNLIASAVFDPKAKGGVRAES